MPEPIGGNENEPSGDGVREENSRAHQGGPAEQGGDPIAADFSRQAAEHWKQRRGEPHQRRHDEHQHEMLHHVNPQLKRREVFDRRGQREIDGRQASQRTRWLASAASERDRDGAIETSRGNKSPR